MTFQLKIVTPSGIFFQGEVTQLNLKTALGSVGILTNHLPMVSPIQIAPFSIVQEGKPREGAISGGFIYVMPSETLVVARAIEFVESIDEERALKAKKRAEERLSTMMENLDIARAKLALQRANARLEVISKHK